MTAVSTRLRPSADEQRRAYIPSAAWNSQATVASVLSTTTRPYVPPHLRMIRAHIGKDFVRRPPSPECPSSATSFAGPPARPTGSRSTRADPYLADLGAYIGTICLGDIKPAHDIAFTEVDCAGGYKWVEGDGPTIAIPGIPDMWITEGKKIGKVPEDRDLRGNKEWTDYNGSSVPEGTSPHEPTFLSLSSPDILRDLDIVTGRNNLRKLFSICSDHSKVDGSVRIDAERVSETNLVLLDRWETPSRMASPHNPSSWHLSYHEAATRKLFLGANRTPGCQRLVTYRFGGLKMLVKCDVDAYLPVEVDNQDDRMELDDEWPTVTDTGYSTDTDSTVLSFGNLSLLSRKPTTSSGITILPTNLIHPPQSSLINLKTRKLVPSAHLHSINRFHDVWAQHVFTQIPNLHVAWHHLGDFSVAPVQKVTLDGPELRGAREIHEGTLGRVATLLREMVRITRKEGRVSFLARNGSLDIYRLQGKGTPLSGMAVEMIKAANAGGYDGDDADDEGSEAWSTAATEGTPSLMDDFA